MDLTVPAKVLDLHEDDAWFGKALLIDVSVGEPAASSHRSKGARQQGALAAERELAKFRHYQPERFDVRAAPLFDADNYVLIPFALETYGCVGLHGQTLLHKLARHCAGGSLEFDLMIYNAALREMRVRIAVGLQQLLFERSQRHRRLAMPQTLSAAPR
jgi:hypothetical protein